MTAKPMRAISPSPLMVVVCELFLLDTLRPTEIRTKLLLESQISKNSVPINGTVRLTGTYLLNSLTVLLVNRTPCCLDIKFCVLRSR